MRLRCGFGKIRPYKRTEGEKAIMNANAIVYTSNTGYTAQYAEGVELAEAAHAALDYRQGELDGIRMRSCILIDSEEGYEDDAYVQQLVFQVKI